MILMMIDVKRHYTQLVLGGNKQCYTHYSIYRREAACILFPLYYYYLYLYYYYALCVLYLLYYLYYYYYYHYTIFPQNNSYSGYDWSRIWNSWAKILTKEEPEKVSEEEIKWLRKQAFISFE